MTELRGVVSGAFHTYDQKVRDAKQRFELRLRLHRSAALAVLLCCSCATGLAATNVEVYVAYAENEHPGQAFMPNPWYGSPNTLFLGYPTSAPPAGTILAWDTGGILIRNAGTTDVLLGPGAKVDGFADSTKSFSLWDTTGFLGSMGISHAGTTIHPGQQVILAQTAASRMTPTDFAATPCNRAATPPLLCWSNFDTSDTPVSATGSTSAPVVHLILDGVMRTFTDTGQVLNTAGADLGNHNPPINESVQWRLIGTTGSYLPGGSGVNPPAVTTWHNDNGRTGLNSRETTLNQQSVNCLSGSTPCHFGKLFTYPVDGPISAQPLFVPNVLINGVRHNTVFITTDNNSVYAFDADSGVPVSSGQPLWKKNFGSTGSTGFEVYSTPVIDTAANTMYLVSNSNGMAALLHALDLSSGADKTTPTAIGGSVPGTGDGSIGKTITFATFDPQSKPFNGNSLFLRPALLLHNGSVYIAFGSNGDTPPYHGWLFGYNAANIAQRTGIYNSTANATSTLAGPSCSGWAGWVPAGGAFWMTGSGPAADANGIYATTGNGTAADGLGDYGDSVLRLIPPKLTVADYYTPYNQQILNCGDLDLGSSGPLLIPNSTPPLLVQASKAGTIYLLNRNSLGKYHHGCANPGGPPCEPIVQVLSGAIGNPPGLNMIVYGSPSYFNNTVFYKADSDYLKAFQLVHGQFAAIPVAKGGNNNTGSTTPSVSSNGTAQASGIVWTVENENSHAVLHAYAAGNLQELYRSSAVPSDDAGLAVNFNPPPTIAAGKVFVAADKQLVAYGGGLAFPLQTDTLTITLQVTPPSNRSKFDLEIDGAQQLARAGNNATTGPLALASGAHVVSAVPSPGTSGPFVISFSGDCLASGAVTLQPGHPATCTVTARPAACPSGETWNPVASMCQKFAPCPAACKNGCFLPQITPTGPVWRCRP